VQTLRPPFLLQSLWEQSGTLTIEAHACLAFRGHRTRSFPFRKVTFSSARAVELALSGTRLLRLRAWNGLTIAGRTPLCFRLVNHRIGVGSILTLPSKPAGLSRVTRCRWMSKGNAAESTVG
jgi:hypothetical protein